MSEKDPLVPAAVAAGRASLERGCGQGVRRRSPPWKKDWTTVSGAPVEPLAGPDTQPGFDSERDLGWPGEYPYTRGVQPTGLSRQALDDAPVRRLRHGEADQRALPLPARPRADRPLDRLPPADALRLRLGPRDGRAARSASAASRSTRSRDMEVALRRHRPRRGHDLDDDQLDGADRARDVPRGRREARDALGRRSAGRSRTTSSRSTSRRRSTSSRRGRRCA